MKGAGKRGVGRFAGGRGKEDVGSGAARLDVSVRSTSSSYTKMRATLEPDVDPFEGGGTGLIGEGVVTKLKTSTVEAGVLKGDGVTTSCLCCIVKSRLALGPVGATEV